MEFDDPLPLIERDDSLIETETESDSSFSRNCVFYGYLILFASWIIFLISMNSIFRIWQYVIFPISLSSERVYRKLFSLLETVDYYVLSGWSVYVVVWWWSVLSWCGLKLFRHSKGILG
ncbi:uncharacterized protein PRCAT00006283001 [Priceomyces carsonii]|uniref:uncharacterized protein n=1 Tax=Priceomyces carsonii TaxID=28549 RepID=UPI002ED8E787|nr:unnamed protein product [Priceomyces carsonii]